MFHIELIQEAHMPRLSRQESQQQTRQKLIEAAEAEILRVGIQQASIRQICEVAGYTLGAFYSNFKDKDELLLEVVDIHTKRALAAMKTVVAKTASSGEKELLRQIGDWLRDLRTNAILFDLSLEFEVYANHSASFRKSYDRTKRKWHVELAKSLEALFTSRHLKPAISVMQMAVGFAALWSGFVIEGSASKNESVDKVITLFLKALLDNATSVK
jgi:AcrR family transcriptional regulator